MRCSDCNGIIEGKRPFCPHCGRPLSGVARFIAPNSPQDKAARKVKGPAPADLAQAREEAAAKLKEAGKLLAAQPKAQRIAMGAVIGAIAAGFLPRVSWVLGAIIGGVIAYKSMRKS